MTDDKKLKSTAAWMVGSWASLTIVMATSLVASRFGMFYAISSVAVAAVLGFYVWMGCNHAETTTMPAVLVWFTCAATLTGLLGLALLGVL